MGISSMKKKKPKRQIQETLYPPPPSTAASRRWRRRATVPVAAAAALLLLLLLLYFTWRNSDPRIHHRFYSFDIVNEFPHDPNAFTQGLVYGGNDTLFESTGLYQRSSVRHVHLQTGKVLLHHQMDGSLFGEGLTLLGERLLQVTWLKKTGFIYDRFNFSKRDKFTHQMKDGWGLTTNGEVIFGSDGSSALYQLDPVTLKVVRRAIVRYEDREVPFVNELEYVNGEVWANIWQTDCIARIAHDNGNVLGWIFLHELRQGLLRSGYTGIDVLNGIAWDEENNRLFGEFRYLMPVLVTISSDSITNSLLCFISVTGKLWPKLYEIKLRPVRGPINGRIDELCPRGYY